MTAQATFSLDAITAAGAGLGPDEQHLAAAVLQLLALRRRARNATRPSDLGGTGR